MPYREPADEIARRTREVVVERGPLLRLDASGRRGRDGDDGPDGSSAVGAGRDGARGGDASLAEAGEVAGHITVDLRCTDPDGTTAMVSLDVRSGATGQRQGEVEVDFARPGEVELVAVGGRGGDGGNGGRGGDGARGRAGADATRWSSGEDGGPGGDGGDGGNGSSGARGGAGGDIVVHVSEHDTPLLMLVQTDVRGGVGGAAGENGRGGGGGPGGSGGSSYSWTERESYTDMNGNRQTRTTHHSKSGGSSGRWGRDGRDGRADLHAGAEGPHGSVRIDVRESGAVASYRSRYDVRLVSFQHCNANDDGIYEPEEKVFVSRVTVVNDGGMPLPKHHDVIVRISDDGWIAPAPEQKLVLPRALPPGATHVFEREELELTLRMFRPQRAGPPLAAPETIHLLAELPRVRRRFGRFEAADAPHGRIVIRFPIEVSQPSTLYSLAPGQATRIRWRLKNVSARPFGLASEQGRAVGVRLVLDGGEIGAGQMFLFANDGSASGGERHVSLEHGLDLGVPRVGAGDEIAFEATIAVPHDATPYTTARFVVSAELGHIADPRRARAVHLQEMRICVGRPFDARGADVLLVVNNRTVKSEVDAWESLACSSGLSISVWDAALEGGLGVLRDVAAGAPAYRLVVVLDNTFDTPAGERHASALLDKATGMELARRGTHVLFVGRTPELGTLLVPTEGEAPELLDADADDAAVLATCAHAAVGDAVARFPVHAWFSWPWSKPKKEHLARRAQRLSTLLARLHPERRYVVVHHFAPTVERTIAWLRRVALGDIEVRRSLDVAPNAITCVTVDAEVMHDSAFVAADVTFEVALRALPFAAKLQLADGPLRFGARTVDVVDGCQDAVVAALLGDLVREQAAARDDGWRKANLASALPLLATLERDGFSTPVVLDGDDPRAARFVELLAWLDLIARDHPRLWEWLPPLSLLRRRPQLRRVVRASLERLVARATTHEAKAAWEAIAHRRKELRRALRRRRKALELPSSCALAFTRDRLEASVASRAVDVGSTKLPRDARVIAKRRHDEIAAQDRTRREGAASAATSAATARASLLREETCDELLARHLPKTRVAVPAPLTAATEAALEEQAALDGSAASLAALREPDRL